MLRKIIRIDEEKCNGCGACAAACHEGAIEMIDGKAKLTKENYCDGLGDCLPACPTNAITFEEREAPAYDEEAVRKAKMEKFGIKMPGGGCPGSQARAIERGHSCPGSQSQAINRGPACPGSQSQAINRGHINPTEQTMETNHPAASMFRPESQLRQWPVQIKLAPLSAPYYDGANLLIAADCTAYAYGNFHQDFIRNRITLIGCPKLDEGDYAEKLTAIIANNNIKSVTIVRMIVPCCGGIENATKRALQASGKFIPWQVVTISTDGTIVE